MIRDDAATDPYFAGVPTVLEDWIAEELAPDEKLVWVGRPQLVPALLGLAPSLVHGLLLIFFGLVWLGASGNARGNANARLFGWAMIAFGLVSGLSALRSAWAESGASYLLTSRRAIIRTPKAGGDAEVETFTPAALGRMTRRQRPDGSGDLIFEVFRTDGRSRFVRRGFLAIPAVRAVEALVRSTLLAHPAPK